MLFWGIIFSLFRNFQETFSYKNFSILTALFLMTVFTLLQKALTYQVVKAFDFFNAIVANVEFF